MKVLALRKAFGIGAGVALLVAGNLAGAVDLYTVDTETPEPRQNELTISYAEPSLDDTDNPAVVAEVLGLEDRASYGVERLYWANDPDSDWRIFLDGHFLTRPDDYSISLEAVKPEEKLLKIDFQYWKDFDYAAGIYYPARNAFFTLNPDTLSETIKRFKISFKMTPSFENSWKLSYSLFERSGSSLSTAYGDDYQYRLQGIASRGYVPSLLEGKETVQKIDFAFKRQEEADRKGFRVHYQTRESDRTRTTERGVLEPSANRYSRTEEDNKDDLFGFSAYTRKQLTDSIYGSVGVAYTRMDGDITGTRVFGSDPEANYDIDYAALQYDDRGFLDLTGTRLLKQWIVNANAVYDPMGSYLLMAGVRYERLSSDLFSSYLDTWNTYDFGALEWQDQEANMVADNKKSADDLSVFVEFRYKGFSKAQLYSRVEAGRQDGDMEETWNREELIPDPHNAITLLDRSTGFDRTRIFWETGVNYYPTSNLKLSLEGYVKSKENDYGYESLVMDFGDKTYYPGFIENQEYYIEDVNGRISWRPLSWLKSISRVDLQHTTIESKAMGLSEFDSADRERMVFNQSIVVTPHPRFFMNASYQLVDDLTETPASELQEPFEGIIVNIPNDYWQVDLNVFYVLTKTIDVQLGYYYLEMSNYLDTSPQTVPYGKDIEQHRASLDVMLHLGPATMARIGYHYYEQTSVPVEENRDYSVHLVKASLQRKF